MRSHWIVGLAVAGLFCLSSREAFSQVPGGVPAGAPAPQPNAGANAAKYGLGVVDVSYVFEHHLRFKSAMEQMKADVQKAEEQLRAERQAISQQDEKLKQFQPGSAEYKSLEEGSAEEKAKFNLKAAKQRKDFLERESRIYYQTYLEVNDAVKYYAQRNNLGLVIRFNGDPIDPNKREDVLRGINNPVIYQGGVDITPDILAAVNRDRGGIANPGPRPAPNPVPRPANLVPDRVQR